MRAARLLIVGAAASLLGISSAFAGEATISLDKLDAVGDAALSQRHGRDGVVIYNSSSSSATQTSNQNVDHNTVSISAGAGSLIGNAMQSTSSFSGLQNTALNTGAAGAATALVNISITLH